MIEEKSELEGLFEKENNRKSAVYLSVVSISVTLALSIYATISTISLINDRTISLVECPASFENDAPVLLSTLKSSSPEKIDKWIKGFSRRFITRMFPRSKEDVEAFTKYLSDHSSGRLHKYFNSMYENKSELESFVSSGNYYSFYAKNHLEIRVRELGGGWVVEVDGFLTKRTKNTEIRSTPTVRIEIKKGDVTIENPEGLYVYESNIEEVVDYVTGVKKDN